MATTTFTCNKDARIADSGTSLGAGASDFNPVGLYSGYLYRTLLGFSYSFSGMVSITSAVLHVRTSTQYYVAFGSDPDVNVRRLSSSWSEGTAVSLSGSNAVEWSNQPGTTGTVHTFDVSTAESTWDTCDITTLMQEALAAGVFYGLKLYAVDEGAASDVTEFYSREQGSSDPYISVTYTTNVGPNAPTALSPTGGGIVGTTTPVIEFTHSDNDGDALLDWDLQVSTDSTFASVTHLNIAAQTGSITGNDVNYTYAGTALTRGTTYYWRARTSSAAGVLTEGPWTAAQSFKVNQLPTVTFVTPSGADALVEMTKTAGSGVNPRMAVRWSFSDPDGGSQQKYRVIVLTDASAAFYDSGTVTSTATSLTIPVDPTRGDFYRVEVIVTDANNETATTGSRRCKAQWAVQEYRIDLGSTVSAWSTSASSTGGTNKLVVTEYASSAAGGAITTWYSSLASAALGRWFHWRVYLFAWSGATTPSMDKMSITYTNSSGVPPDGWTVGAQWALDTGTRVYGTQSLKGTCNSSIAYTAYQTVPVERNTDYILSGRIKTDGNASASIDLAAGLCSSSSVTATQDWSRVKTPIWNSGENDTVLVRCRIAGATGTFAWFDALKLEASTVVTPWTPGFVGAGMSVDAGGLQIDASPAGGATMRLQGALGGTRDRVELGDHGLLFGGDVDLYSPAASLLFAGDASVASRGTYGTGGGASTNNYWGKVGTGVISAQYQELSIMGTLMQMGSSGADIRFSRVMMRVKQQAAFTNQPVVRLDTSGYLDPDDIAVFVTSVAGPTTFELWARTSETYATSSFRVAHMVGPTDTSGTTWTPSNGALQSGTPSGTAYYGNGPTIAGAIRQGGTAFPTVNLVAGLTFWRSDLNMEFFYDGTRWLSTTLFQVTLACTGPTEAASTSNKVWVPIDLMGGSDLWIEQFFGMMRITGGTALSGSHKWSIDVYKGVTDATTLTYIGQLVRSSGDITGQHVTVTTAVNALLNNGTAHNTWRVSTTKTGTPGDIYYSSAVHFRVVAT